MACPNCPKFHSICKAQCCGPVPINGVFFRANSALTQRPLKEILDFGVDILPVTHDGSCVFLTDDLQCKIYEARPDVCKKFGDETHINMTCAFQSAEGKARTKKETKKIQKKQEQKINLFFS